MNLIRSTLVRFAKTLVPAFLKRKYHAFRWPRRVVRWLPGTSRQFGPARRWVRLADYLARHPGTMNEVLPAQQMPGLKVQCIGPVDARFFRRVQRDLPPAAVVELPEARLLGDDGWVVGAADSFILDLGYHGSADRESRDDDHWMLKRRGPRPVRRLPGRTLSLASDFAAGGFGHFVTDSLSRLYLLERAGINPADFAWIFWPRLNVPGVERLVAASGVPVGKIINARTGFDYECESLTATTFPGRPAHLPQPYVEFLRRRFAPPPLGAGRKIYLSRDGFSRQIVNRGEFGKIIAEHGYEICHPDRDPEVLAKCAAATHLISGEGSGFFNAFAAPPGTSSLILMAETAQTLPYNMMFAAAAGHRPFLMTGTSVPVPGLDPSQANFRVDPEDLNRALVAMNHP